MQVVTATLIAGVNTSTMQCEFAPMLMDVWLCHPVKIDNRHTKIQNMNCSSLTVTLELQPSCYTGVEFFGIESDGSVGSFNWQFQDSLQPV